MRDSAILRDGVPALGAVVATDLPGPAATSVTTEGDGVVIDNGLVRAVVDPRGHLVGQVETVGNQWQVSRHRVRGGHQRR